MDACSSWPAASEPPGWTGAGSCCWSRRVRSATCCCKAAIWLCKAASCSGRASSAAGSAGTSQGTGQAAPVGGEPGCADAGEPAAAGAPAHPFFAAIVGMALQGKLSLRQPAAQRFGIDAQATSSLGHRHKGHGTTPFVVRHATRTRASLTHSWENSQEFSRKSSGNFQENSRKTPGKVLGRPGGSTGRLSQLLRDDDDDSSRPNIGGCAATRTSDRSGERKWARGRRDGPAGDGLRRWSRG